jgi:hypothetical protein
MSGKLARERTEEFERRSHKGWRHVIIYKGVEPTAEQAAILTLNMNIPGNGVGFRYVVTARQIARATLT